MNKHNEHLHLRLQNLRQQIARQSFSGYIIPSYDEYLSEYTPTYAKRLEYITGFSGSNGVAIVLANGGVFFFTDGRYTTQATIELDHELYTICDLSVMNEFPWHKIIPHRGVIAYDPKLMNQHLLRQLSALNLQPCIENLVDAIWHDQPPKPCSLAHDHAILSGQNTQLKMAQCYAFLAKHSAQALVITDPASVCWLFNIRGHDVEFSPLLLAHAIITTDQSYLFVENDQIPAQLQYSLSVIKIQVVRTEQLAAILATITGTVLFDENQISDYLYTILKQKKYKSVDNPCLLWKACKNSTELMHAINGHIEDAVALCELLATIASGDCYGKTEYDIGQQLAQLRQSQKSYLCDSFATICGFRENSAIIHYSAHKESSKALIGDGMLLIDSGGQYLGATTDVTRTTYIGTPSLDHKNLYTQVLKGHIAIAAIKFPQNKVCGAHLDVLARQYLWQSGLDYPHGTGHGVGASLNVHEGPQSISLSSFKTKLQAGMILSNEPGYYRSGDFGIRIENLLYIKNSAIDGFLEFENLTLVPYEPCLINENLLTSAEKTYLSNYYEKIRSVIKPLLSQKAQKWLQQACADYMC